MTTTAHTSATTAPPASAPTASTPPPSPPPPAPATLAAPISIDVLRPRTPTGRFPAKGTVGQPLHVEATVLKDGHDELGGAVRWRAPSGAVGSTPLRPLSQQRWAATFVPAEVGLHEIVVLAWTDRYATWRRDVVKRVAAGQDVTVEFEVGARFCDHLAERATAPGVAARLQAAAVGLRRTTCSTEVRLSAGLDDAAVAAAAEVEPAWDQSCSDVVAVRVDRSRAGHSAWYELFPRSYGGFVGTIGQLPRLAALGFDVLYLPPIHPIGRTHRKGRNNTLHALPGDVGSPWAIGAAEGGHTAIHPDLGSEADFDRLVSEAARAGLEIALDYALQCSPDHPWVHEHPSWFTQLPDGSVRYAENPPKKYQDIYPINFWPDDDADRWALWQACKGILDHWIARGVRIFRVDNPHTKPLAFWTWVIAEVQRLHPDVIFLAEAFTTPDMMAKLAEIGFTQSYSYFTWRYSRPELTQYLGELTAPPLVDTMRPNFWPNTPDILEGMLRNGPLSSFALRFVLAATLVPNYGIYSGYELGENHPASPDNTEYLDSEKYQLVERDFDRRPNLSELITRINRSRRLHPALQQLATLRFWGADNEAIIAYTKTAPSGEGDDVVLVTVNLDPDRPQAATLGLDLAALGLPTDEPFDAHDELTDTTYTWQGPHPWVRLDPAQQPAHLLHLRRHR